MKPILFNTEMVRAILDGRKTVTRRVIKTESGEPLRYGQGFVVGGYREDIGKYAYGNRAAGEPMRYVKPPYKVNDILYVRETWTHGGCAICEKYECYGSCGAAPYLYKADFNNKDLNSFKEDGYGWRPSIHMPKEAARIFLRVTGVRVERLQDITESQAVKEGFVDDAEYCVGNSARGHFKELWDSTIKKEQLQYYSWDANPYVWVIEFEVIDKAALQKLQGTVGVMMVNKLVKEGQA